MKEIPCLLPVFHNRVSQLGWDARERAERDVFFLPLDAEPACFGAGLGEECGLVGLGEGEEGGACLEEGMGGCEEGVLIVLRGRGGNRCPAFVGEGFLMRWEDMWEDYGAQRREDIVREVGIW